MIATNNYRAYTILYKFIIIATLEKKIRKLEINR